MTTLFKPIGEMITREPRRPGERRLSHRRDSGKPLPLRWGSQSGQSLIEVSFMLPLLLALLMGTVDLGRYAYIAILVGNAAHAGALYGAQSLVFAADTAGIQGAADNDYQNNGQNVSGLTVNSSNACGCDSGGTVTAAGCTSIANPSAGICATGHWVVTVSVTASGTYNTLFPYPGIPASGTITRTSTVRVAQN